MVYLYRLLQWMEVAGLEVALGKSLTGEWLWRPRTSLYTAVDFINTFLQALHLLPSDRVRNRTLQLAMLLYEQGCRLDWLEISRRK